MWASRCFTHRKPSLIFNGVGEDPDIGLRRDALDTDLIGKTGGAGAKPLFWLVLVRFAIGFGLGNRCRFRQTNIQVCSVHNSSKSWLDMKKADLATTGVVSINVV